MRLALFFLNGFVKTRPIVFSRRFSIILALVFLLTAYSSSAGDLDDISATLLFSVTTNLNGQGVRVAQVETEYTSGSNDWEVNPANLGRPYTNYVTYYDSQITSSTTYPNSYGTDSGHADLVAEILLGNSFGIATNVYHLDEYEATFFTDTALPLKLSINGDRLANQSYTFGTLSATEQMSRDSSFDNFAATNKVLFITGANNGGPVCAPATCYNGMGVGAYGGNSSYGPTIDNGRAKPDICAASGETSFATPVVTASAAILLQSALRGDGGSDTNSASDIRTLKALLMNGAVKPAGWSAPAPSPLDRFYGAGLVNVFNSYKQLTGGKHSWSATSNIMTGSSHLPLGKGAAVPNFSGWDFNSLTNNSSTDSINEYDFNLTNSASNATFTTTITLVWNRQMNQSNVNNLYLYLYNLGTGQLVGSSTSVVDNVQMIYLHNVPAGKYALQVMKSGGGYVTAAEPYALAYEYFTTILGMTRTNGNLVFTWPLYPAQFTLQASGSLSSPNWTPMTNTMFFSNNLNYATAPIGGSNQFFRLMR